MTTHTMSLFERNKLSTNFSPVSIFQIHIRQINNAAHKTLTFHSQFARKNKMINFQLQWKLIPMNKAVIKWNYFPFFSYEARNANGETKQKTVTSKQAVSGKPTFVMHHVVDFFLPTQKYWQTTNGNSSCWQNKSTSNVCESRARIVLI